MKVCQPKSRKSARAGSSEYSLIVGVAVTAAIFMGATISHGITSSLKQGGVEVLNRAPATSPVISTRCLEGAHGQSVICRGVTAK